MAFYKPTPKSFVPIPMQSYSPPLKSSHSTARTKYSGYDGAQVPLTATHHHYHHKLRLQEHDLNLKVRIRILRVFLRFAATAIGIVTATQEGLTLTTFLRTRNHIEGGRGPWALKTELWSSVVLFAVSVLTVILGAVMIASYLISIKTANKVSNVQTWFTGALELGHIAVWIAVAVTYRTAKNGHDLWGWACSPAAAAIQPNFNNVVNFSTVCSRGQRSWILTIASAGLQIFSGIVWYMAYLRRKTKKTLQEHEDSDT